MKIILHVGMPKCGSSALQHFFSSKKFMESSNNKYVYAALHKEGNVLYGGNLVKAARKSPFGHISSHNYQLLNNASAQEKRKVKLTIRALAQKYGNVILSNEGWGPSPHHFDDNNLFFIDEDIEVEVIAYLRPQIEWLNSAWWQWGAWSDLGLEEWLERNKKKACWYELIQQWSEKNWVNRVHVRLLPNDVIADFTHLLGMSNPETGRSNQSLPASLLRFFQKHRDLRPTQHASAIEFILARHLAFEPQKTPWVLSQDMVKSLLEYYSGTNENLKSIFINDPDQYNNFLTNTRWWDMEHYRSKPVSPENDTEISAHDLENMLHSAFEAIVKLDQKIRKLHSK